MAPIPTLITAAAIATHSPIIPLTSRLGHQLLTDASIKRTNMVNFYSQVQTPYISGPASLVLFINAFNLAYMVKIRQFRPNSPEYNALLKDLYARVPLLLGPQDIVDLNNLHEELSMSDLTKLAKDLRLFSTKTYFASDDQLELDSSKAEELKEKTEKRSYR